MKTRIQPGMRKTLEIIALILTITFLIYGVNPKEDGKAYGFKAFAYTVTCSIQSITEGTNPQYQYASAPYEYYNTIAGGTFTVNVVASTNDPNGISSVSFPSTVSTGGSDTSYPYSWTYTWTTSSTYSSSATITCYSYWGSTGTTTLYVYRDITAPTLTFYYPTPANNTYTPNNYTQINITIVESGAGLDSFKFNWNGTNYTFYDDSLVLALNFNNNSAIGDSATTAVDISKYGNNGTMYDANTSNADGNRPPQYTTGRFGKGITFDGVDDWVMIPHSTSLQITTFPITIEAWVYINTTQLGGGTAFVQKGPGTWAQKNYFLGIMNNSAMLSVAYGDGAGWDEFRTTDFPKNQWVHVVGIIKGNDNLELYVNGQNKSGFLAYTSATSTPYATTDTLKIGTLTNSSYFFNGSIDEVRIYKRALSPQEILMHYQSEFAKYSSTEWRFYNNITNLTQGTYSYYGWANDSVANAGQSETRIITIDNVKPAISFQGQTDANGTFTYKNWSFVNVSISDAYNTTGLIDWNSSLVGWWRFNQESEENSTFFKDWSIYGNNATCSGTSCPNITTAGKFGSALTFDGIDDYITVPTDKSLNITNAITLEAWINLAATPTTTQMIIEKGNLAADSVYWLYVTSSGTLKGGVNISGWKEVSDGGSVSPNSWHHVAMVYNGSAVRLWLDGTPTGSALSATGNIGVNNLNLIIGKYSTYYLKGTIDEVRIYNRALSAEEIATSYNAGIYRLYHNFTLLPTGTYTYIAYAQDLAGNVNQTEMRTLIVGSDTTAPTTSISNITKSDSSSYIIGTWTSLNVSVNGFNCTDALSGCLATHACGDWTNSCTPSSLSTPILFQCAAGSVCVGYVRYNSTDNAFNVETTKSSTIYIDAQAPTTTINPNGQACNNSNVSVTLSCSDGSGSGCSSTWYKIVDSGTACDISGMSLYSSQFLVGCPPGSYCAKKICTYSIDNVSNAESLKSSNIYYIDFAGPNAPTGLLPSSGNCNGSSTPTLSWSAPSDVGCSSVAGYQVEIYSTSDCSGTALQTGTPSSNSWTPSALSTGTYSWRVKAKDVYNNWGSWSSCSVLSIDVSSPTPNPATISSTTPISSSQINITATTATDTGCSATVYYQINRTSPTTASSGWQTSPTWADTGLNCNTQYCYTAQTRDSLNNIGTASATSCTYTLVNGPSAPTVTPTSTTSLNVSWTAVCAYNNPQYYANETSYNAGATDSGWTTAMSYIDSGLNCFSQYTYRVKARNNQSVETAYSSTTSRYPIEYVSTCAGTGPSGKCWTLTTCYYTGTGCPSSTTMCASPNTYCKGADSSTCNSGNIDTCCYNVACTSGGASGSTSTVVNTTLCTCTGGNCNSGFCYNSTSQTCYTGVSCTATGWTSTSTNAPPNTPASPSATPSCAGPNTIVNATATITDPNADAMKLQVCKDSACTQTLCNSTQVSSGSQASCQFVASTACTVTGTCTIYLRALENSADACGQIKTSAVINTTFTYDANAPFTNATAITNSSTIYTFNTWTKSLYVNVTLNCTDSGGGTCALTQYCTDTTNTCTPTTTYTAPIQINTQGTTYIRYNSTDNAGNTETTQSKTIKIDTTPPTTTATAVNSTGASYTFNTWTKSPYVNVTLTCNDASGSGCSLTQYCTDTTNTCTPTTTYTAPIQINTQGTTYIRYNSTDNAGNTETTQSKTIKIDYSIPYCVITEISKTSDYAYVVGNTTYYSPAGSGSINISVSAGDSNGIAAVNFPQLSTIAGYGNDTSSPYASQDVGAYNFSTSSTFNGSGTITCYDNAGNMNTTQFTLVRDVTAPQIVLNSPAAGSWKNSNFQINISDSDSVSGLKACYYRVLSNGTQTKGWTVRNCNDVLGISVGLGMDCNVEMQYGCVVELRAYDNVNNSNTISVNFSIDWTPPSIPQNLTDSIEGWSFVSNRTFNWSASYDDVSGVAGYYYAIDDSAPEVGGRNTTSLYYMNETLPSGNHTFYVKAFDNAGNIGGYASHEFLVLSSKGIISTIPGTIPFWTNTSNPLLSSDLSCLGSIYDQQSCNVTWYVNATGTKGSKYEFFVIFESLNYSQTGYNQTLPTYIEIRSNNTPPSKVNLTSPLNNSGTEHDRNMTFVWNAAIDPESDKITYSLVVDDNADFSSPLIITDTNLTSYTYPGQLNLSTSYFWKVRAFDSFDYGEWSDTWNFSIEPYRDIEIYVANVSFGNLNPGAIEDTLDNSPQPIKIRNNGNIPVNISINSTALWSSVPLNTSYYQFRIGNISGEYYAFDWRNSRTSWTNMTNISTLSIIDLGYLDYADEARIDIRVEVPSAEPPATKNATIYIMAS